jgi:hypothetical protein
MEFKIGYKVKPKEINVQNQIIFEEWDIRVTPNVLVEVTPTQDDCEAYGFIWNDINGCFCYPQTTEGKPSMTDNISHTAGAGNQTQQPSNQLSYVGLDNLVMNECFNDLVVGNKHYVDRLVDNTIISGTKAYATATNSIVQGGNEPTARAVSSSNVAEIQNTSLLYGLTTTDGNTKASYLNNTTAEYFIIPDNTAMYFNAEILAVRVGGTGAGTIGDYASWLERGVIINKNKTLSIKRGRKAMVSDGTVTNWRPTASAGASNNFYIAVRGAIDVTIEWASTIRFTEIRANVDLTPEGGGEE